MYFSCRLYMIIVLIQVMQSELTTMKCGLTKPQTSLYCAVQIVFRFLNRYAWLTSIMERQHKLRHFAVGGSVCRSPIGYICGQRRHSPVPIWPILCWWDVKPYSINQSGTNWNVSWAHLSIFNSCIEELVNIINSAVYRRALKIKTFKMQILVTLQKRSKLRTDASEIRTRADVTVVT